MGAVEAAAKEVQPEDVQPEDIQPEDVQPEDVQQEEVKPDSPEKIQQEEVKPEEVKPEEVKPEEQQLHKKCCRDCGKALERKDCKSVREHHGWPEKYAVYCDLCEKYIGRTSDEFTYHCDTCEYDRCEICFETGNWVRYNNYTYQVTEMVRGTFGNDNQYTLRRRGCDSDDSDDFEVIPNVAESQLKNHPRDMYGNDLNATDGLVAM